MIKNTPSSQQPSGDDFGVKAEKLLYTAYIAMMFTMTPPNERNFETLIDMINASECREDEEDPANEDSSDKTIADAFEGAGIKVKSG